MWLNRLWRRWLGRPHAPARRYGRRPRLKALEDRTLLSRYTAATVSDLINDITLSNTAGGSNRITLVANTTFQLTAVNNSTELFQDVRLVPPGVAPVTP
jgi:hypothetical protein